MDKIISFFSGRVGTARLFFFVGLVLVIVALVVWMSGYFHLIPDKSAIVVAAFSGTMGFAGMLSGGLQIWQIVQDGNNPDSDFH
jgi:hypothetical protein